MSAPRDGDAIALRPCPPWCSQDRHFADGDVIDSDDGYHHYGLEMAVPTSYRMYREAPETVVRVILKSWTHPLGAEPGPALIELQLGTAEENTDMCAEITPGEARAVAAALLDLAATAERANEGRPTLSSSGSAADGSRSDGSRVPAGGVKA